MTRAADHDPIPPTCRPTTDRLQAVLDGELDAAAIDADPHPAACRTCRERVAAARVVLAVLANPEPVAPSAGMTDAILAAMKADRYARIRRRSYAASIGVLAAVAASVMLIAWLTKSPPVPTHFLDLANGRPGSAPEPAPAPREVAVRPARIGDEFSKMGSALRGAPRPLTDPAALTPDVLAKVTDALTRPAADADAFRPARAALAELPDAARAGLEPVAGTAEKAFSRLLRDVGAVNVKPKS